jgi:hypothetical protein
MKTIWIAECEGYRTYHTSKAKAIKFLLKYIPNSRIYSESKHYINIVNDETEGAVTWDYIR